MLGLSHKVSNCDTVIKQYAYMPSNEHKEYDISNMLISFNR